MDNPTTDLLNSLMSGSFIASSDNNNNTQYGLNLADTIVSGVKIYEKDPPKDPYSGPFDFEGFGFRLPSTPRTARGVVEGTVIANTNLHLEHGCMMFMNLSSFGGITSDIKELFTLPPARIQLSAQLRIEFSSIAAKLREAINKLLDAVGVDPTGIISYIFSQVRALLRMVNYWMREVKQLIADIKSIVDFIIQLYEIIQYLLSLPARLLAMVQSCITTFLGSIIGIGGAFENIPNQAEGYVQNLFGDISKFAEQSLGSVTTKIDTFKQSNPTYQNIDFSTITVDQIQTLINGVAPPADTYTSIIPAYLNPVVTKIKNPTAYADAALFNLTKKQDVILDILDYNITDYNIIYANTVYVANNITCNNIIVKYNTVSKIINTSNLNNLHVQHSNTIPNSSLISINTSLVKNFTMYPQKTSNGDISYFRILSNNITANIIICDYIYCNNTILLGNTISSNNLLANTITIRN